MEVDVRNETGAQCGERQRQVAQALAEYDRGFSCAEAVFLAGSRALGIEDHLIPRVSTGFGGGLSRTKSLCGALSGAVMVLGLKYGRTTPEDDRSAILAKVKELVADFRREFQSDNCFELTGIDFDTSEGQTAYKEKVHAGRCRGYVEFCVRRALELCAE